MGLLSNIKRKPFYIKWTNWEYWPFSLVYIPVFIYWIYLSIRARSFLFFTAANPGIETGGFLGESKKRIMDLIPQKYRPLTLYFRRNTSLEKVLGTMQEAGLHFPVVAKPDVGERGFIVEKIDSEEALKAYIRSYNVDLLIQEYIDLKEEISVLHFRFPHEKKGHISSFTIKEHLHVTGDGQSSLEELIDQYPRAILHKKSIEAVHGSALNHVPASGEVVYFNRIGNHCRGAKFINANKLIDDQLIETFDKINDQLEGVFYCRYDIKTSSLDDLKAGRNISILEINGVKSEPAHIYDPAYPVKAFYRDIFYHWHIIYKLSRENHRRGVPYMSNREAASRLKTLFQYRRGYKKQYKFNAA